MTIRRVTASLGRTLVTLGVLTLLFVAYQLWGTALHEARAQSRLEDEFALQLQSVAGERDRPDPATQAASEPPETAPQESDPAVTTPPSTTITTAVAADPAEGSGPAEFFDIDNPAPALVTGQPVARVEIPAIGVEKIVVHGVSVDDLKLGPGHFPGTPLPGQAGNAAIAGHRTTYGAPFFDLDQLVVGDQIFVETVQGRFEYRVTSLEIVEPTRVEVILPKGDNRLTFTTCNPKYSAAERLIVVSELVGEPVPGGPQDPRLAQVSTELPTDLPAEVATDQPGGSDTPATTPVTGAVAATPTTPPAPAVSAEQATVPLDAVLISDTADVGGGIGGGGPILPVVLWGLVCLAVWTAGWILGRNWQRAPAYGITAIFFVPALFIFYEQVARLLPENF